MSSNTIYECDRALLISTLPRSGTWLLRYFFTFLANALESGEIDLEKARDSMKLGSSTLLPVGAHGRKPLFVDIDHTFAPGSLDLPLRDCVKFAPYLIREDVFDFHAELLKKTAHFLQSEKTATIVYVFRNPLDVYRSYADLHEQRARLKTILDYPRNPQVPFGYELFNSRSDEPFRYFLREFNNSGFTEYFLAQISSFLALRRRFPERVHIQRFEACQKDIRKYLSGLLTLSGLELRPGSRLTAGFERALAAVELDRMRVYEQAFGHAISGARTFYGEVNRSHFSAVRRSWRSVFHPRQRDRFWERIVEHDPEIGDLLPELDPDRRKRR